jgi:hypothetical protein
MANRIIATVTGRLSENLGNNRSFIFGSVILASGSQGGRFLKKLPPLDPPAKTFD